MKCDLPGAAEVRLGAGAVVDPGVLLGYPSGRPGISGDARIGAGARIRAGSIIYAAVDIGDDFETGHHAVVREENRIGSHCTLWNNSTIDYGCVIGDRVKIHCNVYIAQFTVLEDDVFLAPGVTIANDPHPICTKCMQFWNPSGKLLRQVLKLLDGSVMKPHHCSNPLSPFILLPNQPHYH